jgi:hypothetical protein
VKKIVWQDISEIKDFGYSIPNHRRGGIFFRMEDERYGQKALKLYETMDFQYIVYESICGDKMLKGMKLHPESGWYKTFTLENMEEEYLKKVFNL